MRLASALLLFAACDAALQQPDADLPPISDGEEPPPPAPARFRNPLDAGPDPSRPEPIPSDPSGETIELEKVDVEELERSIRKHESPKADELVRKQIDDIGGQRAERSDS